MSGRMPRRSRQGVAAVLVVLAAALGLLIPMRQAALAASHEASVISAGNSYSCAIESGKAHCWGYNGSGELGDGGTASSSVPVAVNTSGVLAGKTLTQISAGNENTCALDSAGAAYCWGYNGDGELGDGGTASSSVPVAVDTSGVLAGKTLTQISAGGDYACALDSAGAAYCWGNNGDGELGDGGTVNSSVPVAVDTSGMLAGKTLTQISAGSDFACALDTAGSAYCWGYNGDGELGNDSTNIESNVPVAVDAGGVLAGKTLTQISAGWYDACALDSAGAAYCWGYNEDGELGDGTTTTPSSVPVTVDTSGVLAGKTLTQITVGIYAACALDSAGAAYCWGSNGNSQLGNGSGIYGSNVPVVVDTSGVLAGKTLTQISAGALQICAEDTDGAIYCWGDNAQGELGDDSTNAASNVPVLAGPEAPTGVTAVAGDTTATVSWTAPAGLDGGTLNGYTATASPGRAACTTSATTCTLTGLADGTAYSVTVIAHTTAGDSGASAPATVTPHSGPAFTSGASDTVAAGKAFIFTVTTTGHPAPKVTVTGRLSSGVKFTSHGDGTATISGTPSRAAAGVYPLTLTASNHAGTATQKFTLTVTSAPALRKIPPTNATVGVPLHIAIAAAGYPTPVLTESGPLPAGLSFTRNGHGAATITGKPAPGSSGHYRLTLTAASTSGTARQAFTITVRTAPGHHRG